MGIQGRVLQGGRAAARGVALAAAMLLLVPKPAFALEVGCFCTFVFVSSMGLTGICVTLAIKNLVAKRFWRLTLGRITAITVLELVLLFAVLLLLQMPFLYRMLVFLPLAFSLNYTLVAGPAVGGRVPPGRRAVLAGISSVILPATVLIMAYVAMALSKMITFKELRV